MQEFLLGCLEKDDDVRQIQRVRQVVLLTPPRAQRWIAWVFAVIIGLALASVPVFVLWPRDLVLVGIASALVSLVTIASAALAFATSSSALELLGMGSGSLMGARIHREFKERIACGSRRKVGTWPVPCQEVWLRKLSHVEPQSIQQISEAILNPSAHPNVYEVDFHEFTLTAEPVQLKELPLGVRSRLAIKEKHTSRATFASHVRFGANDQTWNEEARKTQGEPEPWALKYGTQGYLEVHDTCPDNLASSDENFVKDKKYVCRFRPKPGEDRFLRVTVYGGYDAGNRNSHVHLRADANYGIIRQTIDLSGYVRRGWSINEPKGFFFPSHTPSTRSSEQPGSLRRSLKDLECDCLLSSKRVLGLNLAVEQVSPGVFRLEKSNVRNGGIIAFEFDVTPG